MDIKATMAEIGTNAKTAAAQLGYASAERKHAALIGAAEAVWKNRTNIIAANEKDMVFGAEKGLSSAMMDRLKLDEGRVQGMVDGLRTVADQPDPVGEVMEEWDMASGLHIKRVRTPLGVIGVIFESRPNVTADAGALCLKAGNAAILRPGSEAFNSAQAIHACMVEGLTQANLPKEAIQVVPTRDRAGICGAVECLLVDKTFYDDQGAPFIEDLIKAGVEVRGDTALQSITGVNAASADDWGHEYLDMIVAAKIVDGVEGAMAHIRQYGSNHTDAIMTENAATAETFLSKLDSAILMHNASTQFADGGEFGMGAEIGIATGKLHARGPVGAKQLTSFKYRVTGDGTVRS